MSDGTAASGVDAAVGNDHGAALLDLYDRGVAEVHGYLVRRVRHREVAQDLTTEVFLGAVESIRRRTVTEVSIAWLIGIARHKLVDHWRRLERERRDLDALGSPDELDEPWAAELDAMTARDVLDDLGGHHRSALVLRYVDDLPVADVARELGRTEHATEALLVRARRAFRHRYEEVTR